MRYLFLLVLGLSGRYINGYAQGCVAIRSNGGVCTMGDMHSEDHSSKSGATTLALNNRYFRSYKHFVGKEEQKERVQHNTQVINWTYAAEFAVTRQLNNRWSLAVFVPVISNVRSSLYEHYGNSSTSPNARNKTSSFGLGDIRLAGYYWLAPPGKTRLNAQVGLGLKLATGDYNYRDHFRRNDSTKVLGPVDQSIQLGDGGTGLSTELNAFYQVNKNWSLYTNAFYLFNPREHNGVSTARGGTPSAAQLAYGSDVMSVPDQYMVRAGANFFMRRLQLSGGLRIEGVPAEDLIGGSNGFRRPGYVIAVEPVAAYRFGRSQFYVSVPYAIERNRTQSVPDKIRTEKTGTYFKGDAAFADYSINFGVSFSLK